MQPAQKLTKKQEAILKELLKNKDIDKHLNELAKEYNAKIIKTPINKDLFS